jgi:glycosyltransferase involved in cell wall biosynthesis
MRILWVKTGPLLPLDTGGKRRTHAMLTEISKTHEVLYLSLLPEGTQLDPNEETAPYAAKKTWVTTRSPGKQSTFFWLDLARSTLFSSRPYALHKYEVRQLQDQLLAISKSNAFDLVVCDFLAPALNFVNITFKCPTVLFQHNIEAQIWQRLAASQASMLKRWYFGLQHRRMRRWEQRLSALFDGVITVSPDDAELARSDYGLTNVVGYVPTGVDVSAFQPAPVPSAERPFTMGFLGSMDWLPNIDACLHFAQDILPLVRRNLPTCRFKIIGRAPPASITCLTLNNSGVEVTGTVDDVQPHVHECDVVVVPLKAGGGTRIKIYEAMAMGVPVVSTTIGAEGLGVEDGVSILLADAPEDFAQRLLQLHRSPRLGQEIVRAAMTDVINGHSWSAATATFMTLCTGTVPGQSQCVPRGN